MFSLSSFWSRRLRIRQMQLSVPSSQQGFELTCIYSLLFTGSHLEIRERSRALCREP